jgi:carotenoid cleavage dioxygenase
MTTPAARVESPFLEGNFAPVRDEIEAENLPVVGELPPELDGVFVRNGPNPQFHPIRGYHWFGGDGMLHGVSLRDGKAAYRNRWIRTEGFNRERAAGRALWPSDMRGPDLDNPEGPMRGNTANTALVFHDGRLLALWEAGEPYHVKVPGLETVGPHTFGGALGHAFTAHPKVDPVTGELLFFGYNLFFDPFLQYSVVSPEGRIEHSTPIQLPIGVMMHDFAITERYALFLDFPYTFSMERLERGGNPFAWEPDRGARIGVLPRRGSGSEIRWFNVTPGFVFHTLNAYEEGDWVVLDICRFNRFELYELTADIGSNTDNGRLHRYRLNLKTGEAKEQPLDDVRSDFPRVNDRLLGRKARFGYASRFEDGGAGLSEGLLKYDLQTGRSELHLHGQNRSGGEGVFVPRPGAKAEDDGWLLTFVHDEGSGESELVVIDAARFTDRPVARVKMPRRVPFGFHGAWVSAEEIASQRP